ncbi:unnamed protein product [Phaeothamnion confervicola]
MAGRSSRGTHSDDEDVNGFERWHTHLSTTVTIKIFGHTLSISQDPDSLDLGTTVWDASLILSKYMEVNPSLYGTRKLRGKRVLELGAGCGLAGLAFALQGADVVMTDLPAVIPILEKNATMNVGSLNTEVLGFKPSIKVQPYCWGDPVGELADEPPWDFIVACDCVYVESLVAILVDSLERLAGKNTTVIVASEKRELDTYDLFKRRLGENFTIRRAPRKSMHRKYDHENSEVLICRRRRGKAIAAEAEAPSAETGEADVETPTAIEAVTAEGIEAEMVPSPPSSAKPKQEEAAAPSALTLLLGAADDGVTSTKIV